MGTVTGVGGRASVWRYSDMELVFLGWNLEAAKRHGEGSASVRHG